MSFLSWFTRIFLGGATKAAPRKAERTREAPAATTKTPEPPSSQDTNERGESAPVPTMVEDGVVAPVRHSDPSKVRVLLSTFGRDRDGKFTARFAETLRSANVIDIEEIDDAPSPPSRHLTTKQALALFGEAAGRLARGDADLLIIGSISSAGLQLYFLPPQLPLEGRPEAFGLGDSLLVSPNFDAVTASLIYAGVLAAALPGKPDGEQALAPHLIGAAEKAADLLDAPIDDENEGFLATLMTFLAVVSAQRWRLSGKQAGLEISVRAFRRAIADGPKEISPLVLSELKIRLAAALKELAVRNEDLHLYEEAADVLEGFVDVLNRTTHKREWALVYRGLGEVLLARAKMKSEAGDCANAVKAFDAALQVFTKDADRPRWVDVTNLRAGALMLWGSLEAGTAELDQAVQSYRDVLGERNRDVTPLVWAQASGSLGAAAFALAKRSRNADLLRESATCFDGALAVYQQHGQSKAAEVMQKNIQRVERLQATL